MLDFIYYAPTKVIFGKDKEKEVGSIIKGYGYKKIMMQYGKDSIKKSGLYDILGYIDKDTEKLYYGHGTEKNKYRTS